MPIDFSPDTPMPIDLPVDRASDLPVDPVHEVAADSVVVVPLLQETIEVFRSRHETGAVRVRVVVEETTEQVVADSSFEEVTSMRVPRDVQVDARREPWHDGDVLVVPVYEEVIVTERRLVLKEEIHILRRTHRTGSPMEVPLRRERAVIERRRPDGSWAVDDALARASSTSPNESDSPTTTPS